MSESECGGFLRDLRVQAWAVYINIINSILCKSGLKAS